MNKEEFREDIFECKLYITDLETNKDSKEINITDLLFLNDNLEFEFGNYEDEDYGTLPYKDFKFFMNDYSVTFYSPQYHKAIKEIDRLNNIIDELEKWLLSRQEIYKDYLSTKPTNDSEYNSKYATQFALAQLDIILDKLKKLKKEGNK